LGSAFGDAALPHAGGGEVFGATDDDAGVFGVAVEVVGDGSVDDGHAAFVAIGGGVGEVGAAFEFDDESDVGGVAGVPVGGDGADVAVLEVGFGGADFFLGDVVDGEA